MKTYVGKEDYNHSFLKYKVVRQHEYRDKFANKMLVNKESTNPIYSHIKTQKILSSLFEKMWGRPEQKRVRTQSDYHEKLARSKCKTEESDEYFPRSRSYFLKKRESDLSIEKVKSFSNTVKIFHEGMKKSKARMNILQKYHSVAQ